MDNVLNAMFQILRDPQYLQNYATDFTVHDTAILQAAPSGAIYAWGIRSHGTHIFRLNPDCDWMQREMIDTYNALEGFRTGRYFEDTVWHLVTVDHQGNDAAHRGSSVSYTYPMGTVVPMPLADIMAKLSELLEVKRAHDKLPELGPPLTAKQRVRQQYPAARAYKDDDGWTVVERPARENVEFDHRRILGEGRTGASAWQAAADALPDVVATDPITGNRVEIRHKTGGPCGRQRGTHEPAEDPSQAG